MSGTKVDPSDISIREARREDVRRVASLILLGSADQPKSAAEIEAEIAHPEYERAFEEILASRYNTLFVAEHAGEVVGTFQLTIIPGLAARGRKRAKIESVHVAPAVRGRGVGAVMIGFALDYAKGKGAGLVELTSHKSRADAHRFYLRIGFDQSHEGFKKLV